MNITDKIYSTNNLFKSLFKSRFKPYLNNFKSESLKNENRFKRIPKILHLYWGLNSKMSYIHYLTPYSFNKFNPEWEIRVYVPRFPSKSVYSDKIKRDDLITFTGENYFYKIENIKNLKIIEIDFKELDFSNETAEVYKSDFLRCYLLWKYGGIWSDFDILYFRRVYELFTEGRMLSNNNEDLDTGIIYRDLGYYPNGFFISSKNNSFFEFLHLASYKYFNEYDYLSIGANLIKSLFNRPKDIWKKFPDLNIIDIKAQSVYPYLPRDLKKLYFSNKFNFIEKNTVGIHWYFGDNLSKYILNDFRMYREKIKNSIMLELIKYIESL